MIGKQNEGGILMRKNYVRFFSFFMFLAVLLTCLMSKSETAEESLVDKSLNLSEFSRLTPNDSSEVPIIT